MAMDASFVGGHDFLMRRAAVKAFDGDGMGFVDIGRGCKII
jgi:hypothetical protein